MNSRPQTRLATRGDDGSAPGWPRLASPPHPSGWVVSYRAPQPGGSRGRGYRVGVLTGDALRDPDTGTVVVAVRQDGDSARVTWVAWPDITTAAPAHADGRHHPQRPPRTLVSGEPR